MSNITCILIIVGYALLGVFFSGVLDDDMHPVIVAFWPAIMLIFAVVLLFMGVLKLGHFVGDITGAGRD